MAKKSALFVNKQSGGMFSIEDQSLTTGDRFFVDSTTGTDGAGYGRNPDSPVATLDYAVGLCTANKGDFIYIMPGHSENIATGESIALDVAGITVVGLGHGTNKPRFDFDATDSIITVGASNVHVKNIALRPGVALCVVGISCTTLFTDIWLEDIECMPGEAGDGTDEFVDAITVAAGCTRFKCTGLRYSTHASAGGAQSALNFGAISDLCYVGDFHIHIVGAGAVAGIEAGANITRAIIEDGVVITDAEPGISIAASTGMIRNVTIMSDLATIDAATVATAAGHDNVRYIEVGNEASTLVKTESADD